MRIQDLSDETRNIVFDLAVRNWPLQFILAFADNYVEC